MKKITSLFIIILLASCATIPYLYVNPVSPEYSSVNLTKDEKKDVTFSVAIYQQMDEDMFLTQESVATKVRDTLVNSKIFNRVKWVSTQEMGPLHYHFSVKITGPSPEEKMATGFLSGLVLLMIPVWQTYNIDMTMFVLKEGKEVYSVSIPAQARDVIWLPLIISTPFLNHVTARETINNQNMDYFMNEIIETKLYK